jgi:hypothetical protein
MSYLKDRYKRVSINSTSSCWGKIKDGVLQGLIIGPLLFLLYINYLPLTINNKSKPDIFVDDTHIIVANYHPDDFRDGIISMFIIINI